MFFDAAQTSSTIDAILKNEWFVSIVGGLIVYVICTALVLLFEPIRNAYLRFIKWLGLHIWNRNISAVITLRCITEPLPFDEFIKRLKRALATIPNLRYDPSKHHFILDKRFRNFSSRIIISPGRSIDTAEDGEEKYEFINIMVTSDDFQTIRFEENLSEIQTFITNMTFAIINEIKMKPDFNYEGIDITLKRVPQILKNVKDLNIDSVNANDGIFDIKILKNSINIIGNVQDETARKKAGKIIKDIL